MVAIVGNVAGSRSNRYHGHGRGTHAGGEGIWSMAMRDVGSGYLLRILKAYVVGSRCSVRPLMGVPSLHDDACYISTGGQGAIELAAHTRRGKGHSVEFEHSRCCLTGSIQDSRAIWCNDRY